MPAGFTFRFQSILDLKEQRQRALEIDLGRLDGEARRCEEALHAWERRRSELLIRMRKVRRAGDLAENRQCSDYMRHVRTQVTACSRALARARAEHEEVREKLATVARERKVVEKYRDRLEAEFLQGREKAEEKTTETHGVWKIIAAEGAP